jgi:hypothetical protein
LGIRRTETDNERRWREAMEKLGVETVRAKLRDNAGPGKAGQVTFIVDKPPHPTREFVETWLGKKEERRARNDPWTLVFAAVAAVTGVITVAIALWHR